MTTPLPDRATGDTTAVAAPHAELSRAVRARDVERVRELLDLGASPDATDPDLGYPLLAIAALDGHREIVEALVARGAAVDCRAEGGLTPLMLAAVEDDLETMALLIRAGASLELEDNKGHTALTLASGLHAWDGVDALLLAGADPNHTDSMSLSPLHAAILTGPPFETLSQVATVAVLVIRGARADLPHLLEGTALECAEKRGYESMAKFLRARTTPRVDA